MSSRPRDEALMGLYTWISEAAGTDERSAMADNIVDIIAVQGLGANPYFTWVRKIRMENNDVKEVMWLRDLLPNWIPNARIATFSYPSDWFTYRRGVKTSLRELGEQLLNELELDRKKWNATHRPIIFIGHSMGGLVIKQALVLASNRPEFQNIKSSTAGIVFLGTPRGGTDLAGYACFIAKLKGNDSTLVQSLKSSDENLLALSHDFAFGYRHLSLTCFYEKIQNRYLGGYTQIQVVEQHSAVMEGENMMYLDTDHSGLNKFSGDDDPNFQIVRLVIEKMVREVPQTNSIDKETDKLHQKIGFVKLPTAKGASFDSHMEEHNSRCLANTREELQSQIKKWAKDRNGKPIFWLNGMAGTGKSTIARTVARLFADEGQLGASFFFKKREGDRETASKFFTTIATDLMAHVPGLIPGIAKAIDADPAISDKALKDQFEKLILQPFLELKRSSPKGSGLIIVIDALDECKREKDIQVILQLLAQTESLGPMSLRVFVTSRPELPIRLGFKKMRDGTYQHLILHDIPKETIEHDLALFLTHELRAISEERSLPLGWPSKNQIDALVNMAIPLFIFAATACRYIGDKRGNPKKRLDIVLQYKTAKQYSQLDKTYLPILNQLLDEEDELDIERWISEFREIVGSIVVLESPLSIFSLAHLLNIPKEDISCRLDLLHSVLNIPVDEDMPVRLLHLSFRDFLLDPQKRGKSPFWVNEKETHKRLVSKCLQFLSNPNGLRQNMCNLTMPGTLRAEVDDQILDNALSLEVRYACRYWVHHLVKSGDRISDGDLVHIFLQKYFLYWLEAMSLMGETSESIHIINSLQTLIDAKESAAILGFLCDGKRFVLRNRSIIEDAPLQLYSSALIFAPEMSIVRTTFKDQIPMWVTRLPKVKKDWDALRQTLEGHSGPINAVSFSKDGKLVASASDDKTLRLWDTGTGSCHSTLEDHSDSVKAVAFSPDGQLVASASRDNTVRLWDADTGLCRSTLEGHSNRVWAVTFSPDGQMVASASQDNTVRLWEAGTGSCRWLLEGHSNCVTAVAFSKDGKLVASASDDYTLRLWDAGTGSCRRTLGGGSNKITVMIFSPDGQLLASASDSKDNTVRLWDAGTGSCHRLLKGHSNAVKAVTFSPDGQLVASTSYDQTVRLWDVGTGSCRSTLKSDSGFVDRVTFLPDGQLAASVSRNTFRLWDVSTKLCRSPPAEGHSNYIWAIAISSDGLLVVSTSQEKTLWLWDAGTGSCRSTLESHSDWVTAVTFSPDGQLVASASYDKTLRIWDTGTGSCLRTLKGHLGTVNAVTFLPKGQLVASASRDDNTLRLWDTVTGSCRSTLKSYSRYINDLTHFSPDGELVALPSNDKTLRLWDTGTGLCYSTLEGHYDYINIVAFSPNGQLVASASIDYKVRLWDVGTGSCRSTLEGHSNNIIAIAFSPDCQLLASASYDYTIRLWDAGTGSCRSTLEGHWEKITDIVFSPDGQLLASTSWDKTVRLWDAGTGSCRSTLEGHLNRITAITFSPDSQLLASASCDKTIRLWNVGAGYCCSTFTPGRTASTLSFSPDGLILITDRGNISITLPPANISSFHENNNICAIFIEDQWVALNGQRFLWLPIDYRAFYTAVHESIICLGHKSGNVSIIGFDF